MSTSKLTLLGEIQKVGREFHLPDRFPHRETGERAILGENARDFAILAEADGETLDDMKGLAAGRVEAAARVSRVISVAAPAAGALFVVGAALAMVGAAPAGSLLPTLLMGIGGGAFGLSLGIDFAADRRRQGGEAVQEALARWEPYLESARG